LLSALVVATVGIFAWTAYAKFADTLYRSAGRQLENGAALVGNLIAPAIPRLDQQMTKIAADPAVIRFLQTGANRQAAVKALGVTPSPADSSRLRTQLLGLNGNILLDHPWQSRVAWSDWASRRVKDTSLRPLLFTLGPIVDAGSGPEFEALLPVYGSRPDGSPLGYLLEIRRIAGRGQQTIEGLLGRDVSMLIGEPGEGVWTDMAATVPGPPSEVVAGTRIRFSKSPRGAGIGFGKMIPGTPWMLWMQQPSSQVLTPLTEFLWAIAWVGIAITVAGALLMWLVTRRITRRITRLTDQAEQIESDVVGEQPDPGYDQDEIDRLCDAFERMATRISAHANLEAQYRHAQKVDAVGRMAAGVAHDFNNILMAIQSFAFFQMEELPQESPLRDNAEQIYKASTRGAELTKQLLAFTRKKDTETTAVDLAGIAKEMSTMLRRLIPKDVDFVISAPPDIWPVAADEGHIEQVIVNLAVNAKDAMPKGGVLRITLSNETLASTVKIHGRQVPAGHYVTLRVSDTGHGMPPEVRARIFEPFFTTKSEGKGTGLGLSTVYGIVDHWGGYITVESAVGKGTTFCIYFPRSLAVHSGAGQALGAEESRGVA
jgi:signal transduction histidine kinase